MKKYWLLLVLAMLFLTAGLVACTKPEPKEAVITGTKDVILKEADTSYDFGTGVSGTLDGEAAEVTVDSSDVEFGKAGEYEVVYTLGDESVTAKVFIYGMPVITAEDAEQKYSDAVQWTVGVSAKDSFGKELQVEVTPPQLEVSGMPEYNKEYTVTYTATDVAGNVATKTRKITVTEEGRPVFEPATLVLTDVNASVTVEGGLIAALKDGEEVEPFVQGTEGELFLSGDYFLALGEGQYTFTLVTSAGYNDFVVTVDAGEPMSALVYGDITNYVFSAEELADLPQASADAYNAYTYFFRYEIVDKAGTAVEADEFTATEGNYTYKISAKISEDDPWTTLSEQPFFLRDEAADVVDLAISAQNINFFRPNVEYGAAIDFESEVTIGDDTSSAYRLATAPAVENIPTQGRVVQLDQEFLTKMIKRGLTTLSMEVGVISYGDAAVSDDVVWIWSEFFGEYPTANGGATYPWGSVASGLLGEAQWTTITFDLSAGFTSPSQPSIYTMDADGNVIFSYEQFGLCFSVYSVYVGGGEQKLYEGSQDLYIRNIRFGRDAEDTSVVNTYRSGDDVIVMAANGAANVEGTDYTYELYKDGTVLFFNGDERMFEFSMQYTKAGENGAVYATLTHGDKNYLGDFQFEDGDILALKDGKVEFALPDYAAQFSSLPEFSYALINEQNETLTSQPGNFTITASGYYRWQASYVENGENQTLTYEFYVCAENDPTGKLYRKEGEGTIKFSRMEDGVPVFEVRSNGAGTAVLYLDGDFVSEVLAEEIELGVSYSMQMYVQPIGNQVYIQWDGQNAVAKMGCYGVITPNGGWALATVAPSMLAYEGPATPNFPAYVRQGDEDFMLFFNGGGTFEFKQFSYGA